MQRLLLASLALWLFPHFGQAQPQNKRPNILLILADDWSFPHAGIYGDLTVKTPNFDRVASSGVLFSEAYVAAPSCTPSRAGILTGRYVHGLEEGANLWGSLNKSFVTYTALLEQAGYAVAYQEKGWAPGDHTQGGYTHNPAGHRVDHFKPFFENLPENQPFCFWYGSRDPHRPYTEGMGKRAGMNISDITVPAFLPDDDIVKSDLADYYYEVQRFDYDIGSILEVLQRKKLLDNTLIVITSDNGMPFPRSKANCYDSGTKVPLAMAMGSDLHSAGKTEHSFINLIDLAPTFLELAGLDIPASYQGKSLLPLIKNTAFERREEIYLERERHAYVRNHNLAYPMRAIRNHSFLLIENLFPDRYPAGAPLTDGNRFGDIDASPTKDLLLNMEPSRKIYQWAVGKRPKYELYHISDDPDQVNNLADLPAYKKTVKAMAKQLLHWREKTKDPTLHKGEHLFDTYPYYGKKMNPLLN